MRIGMSIVWGIAYRYLLTPSVDSGEGIICEFVDRYLLLGSTSPEKLVP